MTVVIASCDWCGSAFRREASALNRSKRKGDAVYCSKSCSGLGRRTEKTDEQKRAEKAEYDRKRREELADLIKAQKAEYFRRTYDPVKAAEHRKIRMSKHVEYCRRPDVKAKKKVYDRKHRAEKHYGEFAECHILAMEIREECLKQQSDYEIRITKGTLNKRQQRRRDDERTHRKEPEIGPLGNAERGQGRQNGSLASR